MKKFGVITAILSLLIALATWLAPADKWLYPTSPEVQEQKNETSNLIEFRGVGVAGKKFSNPEIRKRAATRAAELDADRQFVEWKIGNNITSESINSNLQLTEDQIRSTINAQAGGLLTIKSSYDPANGTATVVKQVKGITNKE